MTVANHDLGTDVPVEEVSKRDARAMFERLCQDELGVSATEFLKAEKVGKYPDDWDVAAISRVEFLLPFVR